MEYLYYKKKDGDIIIEDGQKNLNYNFYNCENIKIKIVGKIKGVLLSKCKKVDITVDDIISNVEVIKSDATKFRITTKCQNIEA